MKKLKQILTGITFIFVISLILNCQVKAQETYDLNGNKVDVITYAGGYEKTTGYRFISSEESGTIAYFDNNGNLIRLVNRATKEIIIDNEKTVSENTTEESTTKFSENVTLKKVTGLKKKTVYKYGYIRKKGRYIKNKNDKNRYGINVYWKSIKEADGYEIYRYENAKKCWTLVKKTKKTNYTFTNMLKSSNVKIRIRAYKNSSVGIEYGKYSKIMSFITKYEYCSYNKDGTTKNYYDKFASEDAFIIQNKYRSAKGSNELKWSDAIYDACIERTKDMYKAKKVSHTHVASTVYKVFTDKYKANGNSAGLLAYGNIEENAAGAFTTPKEVMKAWKASAGHYKNLLNVRYEIGAIGCMSSDSGNYWSSLFGDIKEEGNIHKSNDGEYYTVDYSFLY